MNLSKGNILIGLTALLTACTQEPLFVEPPAKEGDVIEIYGAIDQEYVTRATDDGFAEGDCMGVYIVDYESGLPGTLVSNGNRADNAPFRFDGKTWSSNTKFYFKNKETLIDVYGYYPYSTAINNPSEFVFTVETDQSNNDSESMGGYEKSDFLWAKASAISSTNGCIRLNYTHRMAGVMVILKKGDGISDIEWEKVEKTVLVENTQRSALVDLSKGVVVANGSSDKYIKMAPQGDDTFRAVVIPQSIAEGTRLMSITIDGTSYAHVRDSQMSFTAGKLHKFTFTIAKKEGGDYSVKLSKTEITPWENDKLSHQFLDYEYTCVTTEKEGTLKTVIESMGKDYHAIKNLKITGPINHEDFYFMRDEMDELAMLNMKEAQCRNIPIGKYDEESDQWTEIYIDNYIPEGALQYKKSLRRLILPDNLERIGPRTFREIGLDVNATLIMPPHLKVIGEESFDHIERAGELILNNEIEEIQRDAFLGSNFLIDFILPNSINSIGDRAFEGSRAKGGFKLPENLEYLGSAFGGVVIDEICEVNLPDCMTHMGNGAIPNFRRGVYLTLPSTLSGTEKDAINGCRILNHLILPEGLKSLGREFIYGSELVGGITLPSTLRELELEAFHCCNGLKNLVIPEGISTIPIGCFAESQLGDLELPESVEQISGREAFERSTLRSIKLGKNLNYIAARAFAHCWSLSRIVCLNPEPPFLSSYDDGWESPFCEVPLDHLILEVPEESVELYRNTPGWNQIRFITPHYELAIGASEVNALEAGTTLNTLVRSEGDWYVEECPSWCSITPTSSPDRRTEVTIKINAATQGTEREGKIVLKLRNKDYTTYTTVRQYGYEHMQDKEIVLQKASRGKGIPVMIVGDLYTAQKIVDGSYMQMVNDTYEHLFAVEPFKSYRDYFTVTTAVACSNSYEPGRDSKFGFYVTPFGIGFDEERTKEYVVNVSSYIDWSNLSNSLVICVPEYDAFACINGNSSNLDNASIALCCHTSDSYPYDFRGLVQHCAGGGAFGRLAPEYVSHYEFIKGCTCPGCNGMEEYNKGKDKGWYQNVSLTPGMHSVPWSHLIFDSRYSDIVDIYEGGYRHLRGVYRSENQSCMSTYVNYFNTISRELIVRRIKELAGETFDFEDFVARDNRDGLPE